MKTYTHYTTPVVLAPRTWQPMLMLVGVIEVVVVVVASLYALGWLNLAPQATIEQHTRPLIAHCRVCADEALASRQVTTQASRPPTTSTIVAPATRPFIAQCRVCVDEALGSRQFAAPRAARPAAALALHAYAPQGLIARCRTCADEALGTYTLSSSAGDSALFFQASGLRRDGPR